MHPIIWVFFINFYTRKTRPSLITSNSSDQKWNKPTLPTRNWSVDAILISIARIKMAIFLKIYPILLFFRGDGSTCHALLSSWSMQKVKHSCLISQSIKRNWGVVNWKHTPKQWPCSVQITRLAYKRCDYILYSWRLIDKRGVRLFCCWLLLLTAFA